MSLVVDEMHSLEQLDRRKREWTSILATSGERDLFLEVGWLRAWWQVWGDHRDLSIFRITEQGRTVGFAPFMFSRRGSLLPWRRIELIGAGPSYHSGIIAENGREDVHRAVWEFLLVRNDWDVVEMRGLKEDAPTTRHMMDLFTACHFTAINCPHISLKRDFESFRASWDDDLRQRVVRYDREMGEGFREYRTAEELERSLTMIDEIRGCRWESTSPLSVPLVAFIRKLGKEFPEGSPVSVQMLERKEKPLAISIGFEYRGKFMSCLTAFDPNYSRYYPELVLLAKTVENCSRGGLEEMVLLRGMKTFRKRLNAPDLRNYHFRMMNRGFIRRLASPLRERPIPE
jgi:CelD/BcsL family acetyltransferase involved in cellulose biosynthesis